MDKITIYQKPSCGTCKEVFQALKDAQVDLEAVDYFVTPVPKAKLRELVRKLGVTVKDLIRVKEQVYQDLKLGEKSLTDEQLLDLISIYPDLLQRPIVERGDRAIIARPARKIKEFLAPPVPDALPPVSDPSREPGS